MKKIFFTTCLVFLTTCFLVVNAQDFRIGVKGAFNSTWLFNSNISDRGDIVDYASTFSPSVGLTTMFYFTESIGISLDLLYAKNSQNYEGDAGFYKYETTVSPTYLDIPILFRLSSEGGPYLEIGPQIGLLMSANEEFTIVDAGSTSLECKSDFNSINIAAILGFGYDIQANDNLYVNIGLRFGYGLTDVTQKFSETQLGSSDHSTLSSFAHIDATNKFNYHQTSRAFGGLQVGLIYKP